MTNRTLALVLGAGAVGLITFAGMTGEPRQAFAEDAPPPGAPLATPAAVERAEAATTLPQLNAARGGTLGIASGPQMQGVQATVDAQLLGDQATTTAFAKVGGLSITPRVNVDIFAELLSQDVPRFVLDSATVSREMVVNSISSGAIRLRVALNNVLFVSEIEKDPACKNATNAVYKAADSSKPLFYGSNWVDSHTSTTDKTKLYDQKKANDIKTLVNTATTACGAGDTFLGEGGYTLSLGARVLRHSASASSGTASTGAAFEAMLQKDVEGVTQGYGWFGGVSGFYLNKGTDALGMTAVQYPALGALRLSAGGEFRGSAGGSGTNIIPRVGAYAVLSHAAWQDPFTFGKITSTDVYSSEVELGVYVGGRFTSQFQGLVALRVVKPFGTDQDTQVILSLIPSATSSPQGAN